MNKTRKMLRFKAVPFLIVVALMLSFCALFTLTAQAATNVSNGTQLKEAISTGADSEIVLAQSITIGVLGENQNGLDITRSVTIDLCGKTLEISSYIKNTNGIKIGDGQTLTIKDSAGGGRLIVKNMYTGTEHAIGYGAGINTTDAVLIILSGSVEAQGGQYGAGIGGGKAVTAVPSTSPAALSR